ncbi:MULTISPECIES: protein-glutamate methylesterase/protein-glutamine glutaminase [Nitrosomonas]|uniref:Protein-glutamate methylesterase/protein-glutamine glutaminase n=1 Tax=Nitrosomonas europaea (strain ATCC 19718 / CIP 103999 / KCTC 2705 / NBRC 14298) TaxID=228410 RepID=CHEB_NITEU|nr:MULTISPECIES: chemotaxis response regulator protein-glutamate methylesterase [Nitrosomonas]Q820K0.1 RecName: Full=Protein-glutamate methylesterase/protein-glutamine glutaminase [Nitrosomonas europaea ATCC 19718]KXK50208.1 MAG: chemotaxis-specific methylesterase [Nitrosomonas europaea]MBV6389543.1 Chemotaxis response regulator protein-glutamate methylesterase [Nitrosomonas europaea]QOJ09334.1 MAG: chemotaxis response regulator protein-glutamate methylesterase [Nitrosomonas sp. H1_AOB3]CAD857
MKKISVLIIDDSALIRKLLTEIINARPDMEVIGAAPDPIVAREMIRTLNPDVLTLDVEMPKMDGLEFLEKLMRLRPMPVVMVSTLTERGSEVTFRALELGAVDFVAKPKMDIRNSLEAYTDEITGKIRTASTARIHRLEPVASNGAASGSIVQMPRHHGISTEKLIIIGASTGGTEAIKDVLIHLPPDCPGILITQHMPEGFTRSFAERLDRLCKIRVKEAEGGERVLPGHAYLAPGHSHLLLKKSGANYVTELSQTDPVNRHRPSVDVLFQSAAHCAGKNAVGVILTGMGKDGAAGMLDMHHAGAYNLAQDETSCVVFGMPKEAITLGAVDEIVPLQDMARRILARLVGAGKQAVRV